jgi:hypothetical protein
MQDYLDAVRNINQAYWQHLLTHDAEALAKAAKIAADLGFQPEAVATMINEFSRQPLQEWLTRRSSTSA